MKTVLSGYAYAQELFSGLLVPLRVFSPGIPGLEDWDRSTSLGKSTSDFYVRSTHQRADHGSVNRRWGEPCTVGQLASLSFLVQCGLINPVAR
jgi:hypothetical protein